MLLPFPSPSILQPLIEQHPPLYPAILPPAPMPKKRTIIPHSLNFRYCPYFPNKPPEPGGVSAHSWDGAPPQAAAG